MAWAPSYEDGRRMLVHSPVDLCLVDYRLGARTGIDFLREPVVERRRRERAESRARALLGSVQEIADVIYVLSQTDRSRPRAPPFIA